MNLETIKMKEKSSMAFGVLDQNNDLNLKKQSEDAKKKNMEIMLNYLQINYFFDDTVINEMVRSNSQALKLMTSNVEYLNMAEHFLFKLDLQAYMRADQNIPTKISRGYNYFK